MAPSTSAGCTEPAIAVAPLRPADRDAWEKLARGYKAFYRDPIPDRDYERTWRRLIADDEVHGLGARLDGALAGFAHYLFHPHSWRGRSCYLQDLYTAEGMRGRGVATALVAAVAEAARAGGAEKLYWLTKQDNDRARALYDRIARFNGFLKYDYPL